MAKLSDPIMVGRLSLANRLVMPPMATAKAAEDDSVTDEACNYYRERAKYSRIGLIITEHSYVHIHGKAHPGQVSIASDEMIHNHSLEDIMHGSKTNSLRQLLVHRKDFMKKCHSCFIKGRCGRGCPGIALHRDDLFETDDICCLRKKHITDYLKYSLNH